MKKIKDVFAKSNNKFLMLILMMCTFSCTALVCVRSVYPKQVEEKARYENFERDYLLANDEFQPSACRKVVDLSNNYSSISIPENNLVNSKTDNFEEDFSKPRNKKLIYLDEKEHILFIISYLYTNKYLEPDIITIDTLNEERMKEWLKGKELTWNRHCQFIVTFKEALILIDCTYLDKNTYSEEEAKYFNARSSLFFQEFANFLEKQEGR